MAGAEEVIRNLDAWGEQTEAAFYALGLHYAALMQGYAQQNRPWRDWTHDAKRGLFGDVERGSDFMRSILAHSVKYGPFLELKHQGKYAILEPTVKKFAPDFVRDVERVING